MRSSRDTPQATNHPSALLARRPGAAAGIIAAVIYAILGYALSGQPPSSLPPALARLVAFAPHLIAAINASALIVLLRGRAAIRAGRVASHRRLMLTAAVLISGFLVLYVTRVALGGTKAFPGPATVRVYLYLPLLAIHVLLSIFSVPLVVYNLLVGLTRPIGAIGVTPHPRVGRTAVALWSVSLALGIVVYVMLNLVY